MGARPVLLAGLALAAGGIIVASLVPGVGWLFPIVALMGVGNGVFHPADFAILNASVAPRRLGHAYSTHGIGGNLGYALAPVVSFALGAAFGWRIALAGMGVIGLVALGDHGEPAGAPRLASGDGRASAYGEGQRRALPAVADRAVLLLFRVRHDRRPGPADFHSDGAGIGLRRVARARDVDADRVPARRRRRHPRRRLPRRAHDRATTASRPPECWSRAIVLAVVATGAVPSPLLLPVFVLIGFALGSTGPSRDLIVRAATPKGAAGRVYGFVYSGLDLGGIIGPVAFGVLLDHGHPREMLFGVAACYLVAIGTVIRVRRASSRRTSSPARSPDERPPRTGRH